jgi:DNA-binding LacI/PurR family transcriptional regulator
MSTGPSRRRVGIREVAEAAGVSITTVSHALSGKGRLPAGTRDRVRQVAEQLGYRPSRAARNLVGGRTGLIGLAVSQTEGQPFALSDFAYFVQLISGATSAALEHGYALVLMPAGPGRWDQLRQVELDGAIVVDPVAGDPLVRRMRERKIPLVTAGRIPGEPEQEWWVDNDHEAGMTSMLNHLARRGARRIALVASPPVTSYATDGLAGYERWCARHGVEPSVAVARGELTEGAGFAAASTLLRAPRRAEAIYATLDRLALGALLAAEAQQVAVPDDLLIAGCTDSSASKWARPSLTALSLNPEELGQRAVDMLAGLVEGRPEESRVIVPTRIIPRASTRVRPART